ncbi:flagellar brake domain-containing protein [Shewanella algidipiscicola]|uniref:Type III secretion system flagellar brake protein YcgR PilZN domain-containing protein n=1 Tax=Shewanella algidipiscicola TaxID=614070 RepID=A0ABQ4PLT0_9GAMM|nr:flagellar brake domain-containing protein [Shewanella algidipiscicola]GIU49069.1 hypothetical protein TUM4630_26860 [Shewanella algidipiscicola]
MSPTADVNFAYLNRLSCNTEVQLQLLTPIQQIRLRTRLIGIDPHNGVILALGYDKQWQAAKLLITQGQNVVVRIINSEDPEANILAFRSQIKAVLSSSGRWLVVKYPNQLQSVTLRQHARIPIFVEASLHNPSQDSYDALPISSGFLQDISVKGGGYIGIGVNSLTLEQRCYLQVKTKQEQPLQAVPIIIKNIQTPSDDSAEYQYGFTIEDNDAKVKSFLQQVILSHLFQEPSS